MHHMKILKRSWPLLLMVLTAVGFAVSLGVGSVQAASFSVGDIFASVGNGQVQHYSAAGTLLDTLNTGQESFTTGSAFDSAGNLHVTNFDASSVTKFAGPGDPHTTSGFGSGYAIPESIVFNAAGEVYVGNLNAGILHFDATGNFLGSVISTTRVDWMDLAADQTTMLYTQELTAIRTVNVATGVAGADFATGLPQGSNAFALRILSDGGVLLADRTDIKRFDAAGNVIQSYDIAGENTWFALNLNPDGTSFWSGNFGTGMLYEFDIASGTNTQIINTGVEANTLFGVSIFGEVTQGCGNNCGGGGGNVPEPGTLLLLGSGLAGLMAWRRKQQRFNKK